MIKKFVKGVKKVVDNGKKILYDLFLGFRNRSCDDLNDLGNLIMILGIAIKVYGYTKR